MIPRIWFQEAYERVEPHVQVTPLTYDQELDCFLKWENKQITGSFKVRGAINKVLSLEKWELDKGLVTASAGNHGLGLAHAAWITNTSVTVFASEKAVPTKITAMQEKGAEVILVKGSYSQAEAQGKQFASDTNRTWVSPYNDSQVITGQATLAIELLNQEPHLREAAWAVPVGGGGLLAGIGTYLRGENLDYQSIRLIGVQPEASPFFYHYFYYGSQESAREFPTLADGLAGAIEKNSVTLPLLMRSVDEVITVSEAAISQAIAYAWTRYEQKIEGSAAVTLAALLEKKIPQRPLLLVLTGGNIQPETFSSIIRTSLKETR
jgi:threonine dehydratase